ncbi:MAG: helix-turn-helix transcriptional regulator [Clostridiales bacterium]|nr:helix-turn-helix transcriptional regulator [Clostridiales bacterium]
MSFIKKHGFAPVKRFQEICKARKIKYNELATCAGVTPSTVYSMMSPERYDVSVVTVKKLCDGLEISITDFFDSDIFRNLEQEIK